MKLLSVLTDFRAKLSESPVAKAQATWTVNLRIIWDYNLSNKMNIEINTHILQMHHLKNDDEEIIIPYSWIPIKKYE